MSKKMHYSKTMKECPYCGHDEFYIKQSYSGESEFNYRFNGGETNNSEFFDGANIKDTTKYAYCKGCRKRLFLMKEYYESLR